MGECFFWYLPTRVVPDKRPLNGCVCVIVFYPQNIEDDKNHRMGGSVAEWLACWTQAQKGQRSNRSRDAVG